MSKTQGWIKLHRSLLDWEWYDDANTFRLFLHLLLKANHKERAHRGALIKRGELVTGRIALSTELGLTEQQVRTSLNKLKLTNEITIKTTNKNSVITIVNYDLYQDVEIEQPADKPTGNQRTTNEQPTDNQQITTNKNEKNIKNEKNDEECKEDISFSSETSSVEEEEEISGNLKDIVAKLPKGLNKKARDFFEIFYKEKFNESYYFDKVSIGQTSNLLKKINFKIKEKYGIEEVPVDQSLEGFSYYINQAFVTRDNFVGSNFTIPILSSKFNEIFVKITGNGKANTNPTSNRQQRVDEVSELRRAAREVIRNGG